MKSFDLDDYINGLHSKIKLLEDINGSLKRQIEQQRLKIQALELKQLANQIRNQIEGHSW
jgi:ribosomal protein S6